MRAKRAKQIRSIEDLDLDGTTMVHIMLGLFIQIVCGVLFGQWIMGGLLSSWGFWMREYAQEQEKIRQREGIPIAKQPLAQAANMMKWSASNFGDWIVVTLLNVILAVVMTIALASVEETPMCIHGGVGDDVIGGSVSNDMLDARKREWTKTGF